MRMMKPLSFLTAVALVAVTCTANAATVSLSGGGDLNVGDTGTLDIIVDNSPENYNFKNGALGFRVDTTNPGIIKFTGANVFEPSFFGGFVTRWSLGGTNVVNLQDDSIDELIALSVNTAGLDASVTGNADGGCATCFLFGTIDYEVVGAGMTSISASPISTRDGAFIVSQGADVSATVNLDNAGDDVMITGIPVGGGDPVVNPNIPSGSSISLQGAFDDLSGVLVGHIMLMNDNPTSDPALMIESLSFDSNDGGLFNALPNGDDPLKIDLFIDVPAAQQSPQTDVSAVLRVATNGGEDLLYTLTASVPEPSTVVLAGLALVGLVGYSRRK